MQAVSGGASAAGIKINAQRHLGACLDTSCHVGFAARRVKIFARRKNAAQNRPVCFVGKRQLERGVVLRERGADRPVLDRKSTRLNSSHSQISYAVFCLKKKKKQT